MYSAQMFENDFYLAEELSTCPSFDISFNMLEEKYSRSLCFPRFREKVTTLFLY